MFTRFRTRFTVEDGLSSNVVKCHRSNTRWILMDRHGRWAESIQRKTFHADLFPRPKINATRHCQHAGGGAGRRSVDWDQRRPGPHPTFGAGSIRPILIGLLSSRRGHKRRDHMSSLHPKRPIVGGESRPRSAQHGESSGGALWFTGGNGIFRVFRSRFQTKSRRPCGGPHFLDTKTGLS
jgi:hypothetical protein